MENTEPFLPFVAALLIVLYFTLSSIFYYLWDRHLPKELEEERGAVSAFFSFVICVFVGIWVIAA